jgi:membrane dipeptidase
MFVDVNQPHRDRALMTEVPAQMQNLNRMQMLEMLCDQRLWSVGGTIVDQQDFHRRYLGGRTLCEDMIQSRQQQSYRAPVVKYRDEYDQPGCVILLHFPPRVRSAESNDFFSLRYIQEMRTLCGLLALALVCLAQTRPVTDADVRRIHGSMILIDTHNDITSRTVDGYDIGKHTDDGHTNVAALKAGGVGAQFFAVYVDSSYVKGSHSANRTLQMIDTVRHDIVERYPNDVTLATTADDIERIHKQGKIAALMGIEGGHAIEDSLRLLRDYFDLGIRYMTLTHTNTNGWADSSGDVDKSGVEHHNGLTPFGKQVVREMNRLGMMVDISHTADKTFWDALQTSSAPIIASHSSCRALCNVPRNMTDQMIVALAKKGGVMQINFNCGFLSEKSAAAAKKLDPTLMAAASAGTVSEDAIIEEYRKKVPPATLQDVVAHIDHAVKVGGIDAVGIGSDFDGVFCTPTGLEDVSKFPNLTRALLEKGYSEADIRKIYGGNTLRVMRAVEAEAKREQSDKSSN